MSPAAAAEFSVQPQSAWAAEPSPGSTALPIVWEFPGHGDATAKCGLEKKVGHRKLNGGWCLWDELYVCPAHECPVCFSRPGGYASREAASIADEIERYFGWRNAIGTRSHFQRLAIARERLVAQLRVALESKAIQSAQRRLERLRSRYKRIGKEVGRKALRAYGDRIRADLKRASGRVSHLRSEMRKIHRRVNQLRVAAERDRGRAHYRRPIHVTVGPPPERWAEIYTTEGYRVLRAEAYEQARARGVDAGVVVFHHIRLRSSRWAGNASLFEPDELDCPVDGPHWHIIGDGWVIPRGPLHDRAHELAVEHRDRARGLLARLQWVGQAQLPRASRATLSRQLACSIPSVFYGLSEAAAHARDVARAEWFVSNLGVRVSVYETAHYVLTHAGFARVRSDAPEFTVPPEKLSRRGGTYPRARGPVETVTWFGMSEFRRSVDRQDSPERHVCARCGELLGPHDVVPVAYLPAGPPPKGDLEGKPDEWRAEGLNVPRSRAEISTRLERKLRTGRWKLRELRGLERWEFAWANTEAQVAAFQDEEWRAIHGQDERGRRAGRGRWVDHLNGEDPA